jgi:hypothetical protein
MDLAAGVYLSVFIPPPPRYKLLNIKYIPQYLFLQGRGWMGRKYQYD